MKTTKSAAFCFLLVLISLDLSSASSFGYSHLPLSEMKMYRKFPSSSSSGRPSKICTAAGIDDLNDDDHSLPSVENELMPIDRLASNDPKYLEYLASKKSIKSSTSFKSILGKKDFMKMMKPETLQDWLEIHTISVWQTAQILESPNFNGLGLKYLNSLPVHYIQKREIVPFEAFMNRFEYLDEFHLVLSTIESDDDDTSTKAVGDEHSENSSSVSTPFTDLASAFSDPEALADPTLEPFFHCLLKTQPAAFHAIEVILFDDWLRTGPEAWKYIRTYFKESGSSTQSFNLASILASDKFADLLGPEFIEFLFKEIPEFNVNVRILYPEILEGDNSEEKATPLLHVLVLKPRLSEYFLSNLLKSPLLDVDVPTGKVTLRFTSCTVSYVDQPIAFLAAAIFNLPAMFHLNFDGRALANFSSGHLLLFLIYHLFNILFRSLINDICKLFPR